MLGEKAISGDRGRFDSGWNTGLPYPSTLINANWVVHGGVIGEMVRSTYHSLKTRFWIDPRTSNRCVHFTSSTALAAQYFTLR